MRITVLLLSLLTMTGCASVVPFPPTAPLSVERFGDWSPVMEAIEPLDVNDDGLIDYGFLVAVSRDEHLKVVLIFDAGDERRWGKLVYFEVKDVAGNLVEKGGDPAWRSKPAYSSKPVA